MTDRPLSPYPVIALVQARLGSRRLPGKMLADLAGRPVLAWVLERVRRTRRIDRTVLCTTRYRRDDALEGLAREMGVSVFRGEEDDVLGRFSAAARTFSAATVIRVCADNPLISPEALDILVSAFLDSASDYAFNHVPGEGSTWPDGLGAEILSAALLHRLTEVATLSRHREHVTSFIREHPEDFHILAVPCPAAWQDGGRGIRLDIDTPADLERMQTLCAGLTPEADPEIILARWTSLIV